MMPGLFDERDALFAFVDRVVGKNGNVDDHVFADVTPHNTPEEIVELAITATRCVTTRALARSLRIRPDADCGNAMGGKV